jgi:hypothetical protein
MRTLLLSAAVALAFVGDAVAVTCVPAPARVKLDAADAAFVGRLSGTELLAGRPAQVDYIFLVDQVVKGDLPRRVVVRSGVGGDALGFALERDVATGILLNRENGLWVGGLCGQLTTSELVEATRDDEQIVNWGGVVVGILVLGAGAYFLRRKLLRNRSGSTG